MYCVLIDDVCLGQGVGIFLQRNEDVYKEAIGIKVYLHDLEILHIFTFCFHHLPNDVIPRGFLRIGRRNSSRLAC